MENKDHKKIKLELTAIDGAFVMDIQGKGSTKKCLCLPIEDAHLFLSQKTGRVYLDVIAWETNNPLQSGDTHNIKRSLTRDESQAMTQEQRNALPVLGYMAPLYRPAPPQQQPVTQGNTYQQAAANQQPMTQPQQGDLPF